MTEKRIDKATGTEFVGHEWDGIEELNTPLPRWWLIIFYTTVIWAIGFTVAYPAWPLIESATGGMLGWSSRQQLEQELAAAEAQRAPLREGLSQIAIQDLPDNPELLESAIQGGRAAFNVHCVQCHGTGAAGSPGYPNLNDDDWLWGGDLPAIEYTITHGVRNPDHDQTRFSQMPAFGRDGILTGRQIQDVVSYVRVLGGSEAASASSRRGAEIYANNCAVCHGPQGHGDRAQGAPNLTDAIWLYGGDRATMVESVTNSRQGVMPRWGHILDPVTIRMLAAYVHSLGGGEDYAAPTEEADAEAAPAEAGADERS